MNTISLPTIPANAVECKAGRPMTTSLRVAAIFGKNHRDVMRAVRNMECPDEFRQRNFAQSSYINEQGKSQPMVEMTKDGFVLLVMGFTGPEAMGFKIAYIQRFNEMETLLSADADLREAVEDQKWVTITRNWYMELLERAIDKGDKRFEMIERKRRASPAEARLVARLARLGMTALTIARSLPMPIDRVKEVLESMLIKAEPTVTIPLLEQALAAGKNSRKH